jgi:hypothetical protein
MTQAGPTVTFREDNQLPIRMWNQNMGPVIDNVGNFHRGRPWKDQKGEKLLELFYSGAAGSCFLSPLGFTLLLA